MELRHLRCFLAVAEELHFARAAEKLHIEQSPLSRAIKELEEDLGAKLFCRTTRSTRLTRAGKLLLEHVPRVFIALQQARDCVKAAANGFHGQLRVALSDGIPPSRFATFLALCREEEPEIEIRLFEVPLAQQIKGLHDDLYDVGFARSEEVGDGIIVEAISDDPLMVAVPARHPLLAYKRIPLEEVLRHPLVLADPHACEGYAQQIERVLRRVDQEPLIAERVASCDLMMAMVTELVRATMRLRPDRVIVGEVRGGEALDLIKVWGTGHPGGIATIHAGSALGALLRLEQLILEVAVNPPRALVAEAVNVVIHIAGRGRRRRIESIARVLGFDDVGYRLADALEPPLPELPLSSPSPDHLGELP